MLINITNKTEDNGKMGSCPSKCHEGIQAERKYTTNHSSPWI